MSKCCCDKENTSCACGNTVFRNDIPAAQTVLTFKDTMGAWKARWSGAGRMDYRVEPGIYRVNNPDESSPVLVSANYKLTFDTLRKNLSALDCWLLILDTKGVNVWCASGEGTFGTEELINRIEKTALAELVNHRKLILPQLGASGVCAYEVAKQTGFSILFGPVRAKDIKAYVLAGFIATEEMRRVTFTLKERIVLTPIEIVESMKYFFPVLGVLFILNLFVKRQFGFADVAMYLGAKLAGAVLTPILLPYIPGKAFSFKGWLCGLCWAALAFWIFGWYGPGSWLLVAGYGLLLPAVSSFLAMNFTGSSTYTSPSGVLREMKIALPLILISDFIGAVLVLIKAFMG
jgi:hypothetical protein